MAGRNIFSFSQPKYMSETTPKYGLTDLRSTKSGFDSREGIHELRSAE